MPCTEAYKEHIMYTFNGFCKTVIRFAAINMVVENEFVYQRINTRLEEATNRAYDFSGERDDSQAVQSNMLHLMSQLPKVINSNNLNRINRTLNDSINSGVIGSKAVLELLKYPAYAGSISATIRERAFSGSKSAAEHAFDILINIVLIFLQR